MNREKIKIMSTVKNYADILAVLQISKEVNCEESNGISSRAATFL